MILHDTTARSGALTYPEQVKIAFLLTRPTFLRAATDPDVDETERRKLTVKEVEKIIPARGHADPWRATNRVWTTIRHLTERAETPSSTASRSTTPTTTCCASSERTKFASVDSRCRDRNSKTAPACRLILAPSSAVGHTLVALSNSHAE